MNISPYSSGFWKMIKTGVHFEIDDSSLKSLYDRAEKTCRDNLVTYNDKTYLREGGHFKNVWLETQPMGGAMYACRNTIPALNNILVFMQYQRQDGRMPGMLYNNPPFGFSAAYDWFQGFCFPQPALQLYYYIGRDNRYLQMLYDTLKNFDNYLWTYRDSNGDGCLERWCCWDTGEDNLSVLLENGGENAGFGGETPPPSDGHSMPWDSMEFMAYSYSTRKTLSIISEILSNGEAEKWMVKATKIQNKVKESLWKESESACFDRYSNGDVIDCLSHTNLRCMYYGLFTQEMADAFVKRHLFNPQEFYTNVPFPSIAVNNKWFRNLPNNNWSGPVQGLTMQRAIQALANYNYHSEILDIGQKWIHTVSNAHRICQQYDPFNGAPGTGHDDYGPTALSVLEYYALCYGIHVEMDRLAFGSYTDGTQSIYSQVLGDTVFTYQRTKEKNVAQKNGTVIFESSPDLKVITDWNGHIIEAIYIGKTPKKVWVNTGSQRIEKVLCTDQHMIV